MIGPLLLGTKNFPVNIIQGPLAGVSSAPFRGLVWRYSQPAFSCTEMISCKTLLHQSAALQRRFVEKHPDEGAVCFQLSSNNPAELAEATRRVTDLGADLIDLNCGCPVRKIRSKGAGSRLLANPQQLYQLIHAMKQNTSLPVSVKIRVDGHSSETHNQTVATVISDAGADFVVVHGRHWTEGYDTACRYDHIQFFVEQLSIPVIGNGDISDADSLKRMFATGCAGVMIGRAGVGQPWLINKLIAQMRDEHFISPSQSEISMMLLDHISQLAQLLGSEQHALLHARKIGKYYARGITNKTAFMSRLNSCHTLSDFELLCRES